MILPLAGVSPIMSVVLWVWVFVALVLILIVLVQKGKGGGLSGAFGGMGASSLLGTKTGDFLTWVTVALVVLFLSMAVLMAKFYRPQLSQGLEAPSPATTTIPTAPLDSPQIPAD